MSLRRSAPALLVCALSATACQKSSSGGSIVLPSTTSTSNLGLAMGPVFGSGSQRLLVVAESGQGRDLDGDGDTLDGVVHVVDLEQGSVVNTGLALEIIPLTQLPPPTVVAVGESLAFGVSERETGGLDLNGDGDAEDNVLAFYERDSASVTNLALAASNVVASADLLAFDVPEAAQGEDLDGDGEISAAVSVPFVHDLRTGETWNTGLRGAGVLAVDGDFVALALREALVGDQNGDGDAQDLVFELYDVSTRTVQPVGLALRPALGGSASAMRPLASSGRWVFDVDESDQGADLNGDGDLLDRMAFVYDTRTRTARDLGQFTVTRQPGIEPLVLFDSPPPESPLSPFVWIYDVGTDLLVDTGLHGLAVQADGERLAVLVPEVDQGEDLDHNGALESTVPVLYDLASGRTQNLGIDAAGARSIEGEGGGLLLFSRESVSRRDWNGDGDRDDDVLFTWDERSRELVNTRLDANAASLGRGIVLVVVNEVHGAGDLNGDGDSQDTVLEAYDLRTRQLTSLGLAVAFAFEGASDKALLPVYESEQGQDLNGDGDQIDLVLHLVQVQP